MLSTIAATIRRVLEPLDRDQILVPVDVAERARLAIDNLAVAGQDTDGLEEIDTALFRALAGV